MGARLEDITARAVAGSLGVFLLELHDPEGWAASSELTYRGSAKQQAIVKAPESIAGWASVGQAESFR